MTEFFLIALAVCLVLQLILYADRVAMLATFLFTDAKAEERQLQWLHLKLRVLKGVAKEIGRTEAQLAAREPATSAKAPGGAKRKG